MNRRAAAALLVCAAAAVPYVSVINDYFIQDDFGVVSLLSGKPATAFFGWFASTWMDHIWGYTPDEIRPFPAVTYQIAAWWGAASPAANHVINIACHAVNAILVLALGVWVAGLRLPAATLGAVAFALMPIHPETVAWVTGRVDSMPAMFYVASFLAYARWRQSASAGMYWGSVALFFVALFTKQNTVTLPVALVLYDLTVDLRGVRVAWGWLRPYVPFGLLTAGYLVLRYLLFGEIARESQLTALNIALFQQLASRHLRRIVAGQIVPLRPLAAALAAGMMLVLTAVITSRNRQSRRLRAAFYFGVIWIALGIAPIIVAGYESPRHVYLASMGWAVVIGIGAQLLWEGRPQTIMRALAAAGGAALLALYGVQLRAAVRDWNARAAVSQQAVKDLEQEALQAPRGALIIAGAPVPSWEWALPFAARPPFARADLTRNAFIISPMRLHCCRSQWHEDTRRMLEAWARSGSRAVIALRWDPQTGRRSRLSDDEDPFLRSLLLAVAGTTSEQALEGGIEGALDAAAAPRLPRTLTHPETGSR